jgi:hypothetical protein
MDILSSTSSNMIAPLLEPETQSCRDGKDAAQESAQEKEPTTSLAVHFAEIVFENVAYHVMLPCTFELERTSNRSISLQAASEA